MSLLRSIFLTSGVALACLAQADTPPVSVHLDRTSELRIDADAATTAAKLARDWGQFEFSLPRKHFPVPAPKCRDRIKLRLIGVPPGTSGRDEIIEQRWLLLQTLRHYTSRSTSGQIQLRYCNAFSDGTFHVVRP